MFVDLTFVEAAELYFSIRRNLPGLLETFGEAGLECIVDALHIYVTEGHALDCCRFDLDFARLFTLAFREYTGHDLKPEFSCLTSWCGANPPIPTVEDNEHGSHNTT